MTKEPTKGERTRQSILDSAYTLFIEQGYAATSMRQVAERAGLALGGIYNHFASKDLIFEAIILERHPLLQVIPVLHQASGATAEEFVRSAAHNLIAELGHHPDFLHLMLIEMVEFKGTHTPQMFERVFPQVLEIAQRFQSFGPQLRKFPPPILMRAFLGLFFSYYITGLLLANSMPPEMYEGSLDRFVDIFLRGILTP